LCWV